MAWHSCLVSTACFLALSQLKTCLIRSGFKLNLKSYFFIVSLALKIDGVHVDKDELEAEGAKGNNDGRPDDHGIHGK